jgi:hypothetical protein
MEAICSSETSVETQRTARSHIPEVDTLHNHRCENLKSYKGDFPRDFGKWMQLLFVSESDDGNNNNNNNNVLHKIYKLL